MEMKNAIAAAVLVCSVPAWLSAADPPEPASLWAGIAVNRPLFTPAEVATLDVSFTLVNDGTATVDPDVDGSSRLVVDDAETIPIAGGPRDARFRALPPGDHLRFGYAMGENFAKPGVYRVRWEGKGFRSADVTFRVLGPKPPAPPDAERTDPVVQELIDRSRELYRRLAILAIREFLNRPGRGELAAEMRDRLDRPDDETMTVYSGTDNTLFVDHLRDFAVDRTPFDRIDPKDAVVVYLNGPVGGGSRIGVVLRRSDGEELALVIVPGK